MGCPPAPVYKGGRGRCGRPRRGHTKGSPTPTGSRTPSFLVGVGEGGKEEEEGKERGALPPFPCPIRTRGGGGARPALAGPPLFPHGPCRPNNPRRVPVTPRYYGKMPISPGTLPMSKHRLPIYRSLCLDHFKTPRYVRDHIRDSEQTSVHQNL